MLLFAVIKDIITIDRLAIGDNIVILIVVYGFHYRPPTATRSNFADGSSPRSLPVPLPGHLKRYCCRFFSTHQLFAGEKRYSYQSILQGN